MANEKGNNGGETLIFTCAGAAHCGQVANRAGVQLRQEGAGALFCTAAVAAAIPDKLERTRNAERRVVLDGCEDRCSRKIMDQAGIPVELDVMLADLGIERQPAQPSLITDAKKVVNHVTTRLGAGTV
jgi:uncharacterized metal-binding protein